MASISGNECDYSDFDENVSVLSDLDGNFSDGNFSESPVQSSTPIRKKSDDGTRKRRRCDSSDDSSTDNTDVSIIIIIIIDICTADRYPPLVAKSPTLPGFYMASLNI